VRQRPDIVQPPIVLFDLDETLIDRHYRPNLADGELRRAFGAAIERGFVLGLNSDSPYESLLAKYRMWGMNGPIVSERGARVADPQSDAVSLFASGAAAQFPALRERLVASLERRGDLTVTSGHVWELAALSAAVLPEQRMVIVNPHRQSSLSFWVRTGAALRDEAAADRLLADVVSELEALIARDFPDIARERDTPFDVNRDYGICVAQLRTTSKTAAVRALADGDRAVFMIGNSKSDWIEDPRILHGAVANSDPGFKDLVRGQGGLLANAPLTQGAVEMLAAIVDEHANRQA
jgi:hypothetical protein